MSEARAIDLREYWEHQHAVPRDPAENLRWRRLALRQAATSDEDRNALWSACRSDLLFFVNTLCFTYDPRRAVPYVPFATWPFQDLAMTKIAMSIRDGNDVIVEKSRDMGASWMILAVFLWRWMFWPGESYLLVSRKEALVDQIGDPASLFWKIDCMIQRFPKWIVPEMDRKLMHLGNLENESTIDGSSTTGDVARGDRRTAIMMDEFGAFDVKDSYAAMASTRDATNCRVFNSTPPIAVNAFTDIVADGKIPKVTLHWTVHPIKAEGIWYDEKGKPRSPWYDEQCRRVASPVEIARELDIDYQAATGQFYPQDMLARHQKDHCRPPMWEGDLVVNEDGVIEGWFERQGGSFRSWIDPREVPKDRRYAIGCDISMGTGASNSVMSIVDVNDGKRVAGWTDSGTRPDLMARMAFAIGRHFCGTETEAQMIWEQPGPGRIFGEVLLGMGYRAVYWRREEAAAWKRKPTDIPGWIPNKDNKKSVHSALRAAMSVGEFVNQDADAVRECGQIVYLADGGVGHSKERGEIDPSGARDNHGDRPTADALAWHLAKQVDRVEQKKEKPIPDSSVAHRKRQWELVRATEEMDGW